MTRTTKDEEEPFLLEKNHQVPKIPLDLLANRYFTIYVVFIHILLSFLVIKSALSVSGRQSSLGRHSIFPELRSLRTTTSYEHATNHTKYSAYSGPPDTANAAAWEHLMQSLYFNISVNELLDAGASPEKSVRVKDGGYIASLGVYHQLHCLVKMRNFLYGHRHSQNLTIDELDYWYDHLDHCIELLRLSTMCTPDLSVYSFTWPADANASFLDAHSSAPRTCVDWDQLASYMWKRKMSLTPTLLFDIPDHFRE